MSANQQIEVAERLKLALSDGRIPSSHLAMGTQVLSLLQNAVKTTFVGLPGSGKTKLINMILGKNLLHSLPGIDVTEITYGRQPKTTFVFPDGTLFHRDGLPGKQSEAAGAVRALVELPETVLRQQSFTEVSLTGNPEQQIDLFKQTIKLGQVTVWCSETFGPEEQAIWNTAPDAIKDHSFLALTMADRLLMKNLLIPRIQDLGSIVSEEFLGLYPVATLQAIAARADKDCIQMDLWESSGGKDLLLAIQDQVKRGRNAELDRASMLLAQYAAEEKGCSQPQNTAKKPDAPRANPKRPNMQQAEKADGTRTELSLSESGVVDRVHDCLQRCAEQMQAEVAGQDKIDPQRIIDQCCEAVSDVSQLIEADGVGNEHISGILRDIRDGEEMLLLLQVEHGAKAAEDAVVLMLQLKKELPEISGQ